MIKGRDKEKEKEERGEKKYLRTEDAKTLRVSAPIFLVLRALIKIANVYDTIYSF